jgi:hypothetical protein
MHTLLLPCFVPNVIRRMLGVYAYTGVCVRICIRKCTHGRECMLLRITCVSCVYMRREIEKRTHTGRFVRVTRESTGSQLAHSSGHSGRELLLREGRSPASLFVSYQLARRLHLATITASARAQQQQQAPMNLKLAEFLIQNSYENSLYSNLGKLIPFLRFVIYSSWQIVFRWILILFLYKNLRFNCCDISCSIDIKIESNIRNIFTRKISKICRKMYIKI